MTKRKPNIRTINKALDTLVDTVHRKTLVTCHNRALPATKRKLDGEVRAAREHLLDVVAQVRGSR